MDQALEPRTHVSPKLFRRVRVMAKAGTTAGKGARIGGAACIGRPA